MRIRCEYLRNSQPHLCGQELHSTHCWIGNNMVWSTIWTVHGRFDLSLDILIIFMESLPLKFWLLLLPSVFQMIPDIISGTAHTIFACTKLLKKQTRSPLFTWAIFHFFCLYKTLLIVLYFKICNILGSSLLLLPRYYSVSANTGNTDNSRDENTSPSPELKRTWNNF